MKLLKLGGTDVTVSPLLLLAVPLAFITGHEAFLITAFVSLSIHEAAHALTAHRLGLGVENIEIRPFGFTARLSSASLPPADAAAVFLAGPMASLVLAAFNALGERLIPRCAELSQGVTEFNLIIAVMNLLPAYPLDGGRLVHAAAGRRSLRVLRFSGVLMGAAFLAAFALLLIKGFINPTFAVMGAFLIWAALTEPAEARTQQSLRTRLRGDSALPVRSIAVSGSSSVSKALMRLPEGEFAVVSVLDDGLRRIGELDETQLYTAAGVIGSEATLAEAVALYSKRML